MTIERLQNILKIVCKKYEGVPREFGRDLVVNDICAVLRGLNTKEDFLNSFEVFYEPHIIICHNAQELQFITFLPYLYKELQFKEPEQELFSVYVEIEPQRIVLQGMCSFIDTRLNDNVSFGFDFNMHQASCLGVYYPDTNEFKRWR